MSQKIFISLNVKICLKSKREEVSIIYTDHCLNDCSSLRTVKKTILNPKPEDQ